MKKIVALLIMLFTAAAMAQQPSWSSLRETNINVGTNAYDIFTNGAGNHIIVQETNALKYFKMNTNGNTIINSSLETSAVISPSISGDHTRIYSVYRIDIPSQNNKIKTKYSTNGGSSWSYISDLNTPSGNASSIECVFSKDNLHVIYLIGTDVFHSYYNTGIGGWVITQQIYDGNYTPANPRISINTAGTVDTVYFTFDEFETEHIKWRRYIVGGSLGPLNNMWMTSTDCMINLGLAVDNNYIYYFYKPSQPLYLQGRIQRIWNNSYVESISSNNNIYVNKIFTARTTNNKLYSASWSVLDEFPNSLVRMRFNRTSTPPSVEYDVIHTQGGLTPVSVVNLSSAGNDVHVVWKDNLGNNGGNNLRYKYYDDIPLPPQNLTITKSANNHPLLSWINPNPDANIYKIFRLDSYGGGWQYLNQTSNTSYEDQTLTYCIPPQICPDQRNFYFRVTTVDLSSKESDPSNEVAVRLVGNPPPPKIVINNPNVEKPIEYSLGQNYPNPFNPETRIDYSIKSPGNVSLNVYDILGKEVDVVVNEVKEAGNYSVIFNAANLPSGMYVYILYTDNFIDTKKLILLK